MPSYRCYFLNDEDHIQAVENVDAELVWDAIDRALAMLKARPHTARWRFGRERGGCIRPSTAACFATNVNRRGFGQASLGQAKATLYCLAGSTLLQRIDATRALPNRGLKRSQSALTPAAAVPLGAASPPAAHPQAAVPRVTPAVRLPAAPSPAVLQ